MWSEWCNRPYISIAGFLITLCCTMTRIRRFRRRLTLLIWLYKKIRNNYDLVDVIKMIRFYRYVTFIIISLFFLLNKSYASTGRKLIFVICIGVSCILINHLYIKLINGKTRIIILLLMETLFNAFILVPSGGLDSPYIWYSLNTILVASFILKQRIYSWINLGVYLFSSTWILFLLTKTEYSFSQVLLGESNFILSLVLFTEIVLILSEYSEKIQHKNEYLQGLNQKITAANDQIKESMNYIMELYQAVHLLTTQQDEDNLEKILTDYAIKMTHCNLAFFNKNNQTTTVTGAGSQPASTNEIEINIEELELNLSSVQSLILNDSLYILAPVKCKLKLYGYIGIKFIDIKTEEKDIADQLTFLSELGTIVLEKFELEKVNRHLLINEEQNRIANEIHDGVLQRLFSISCGIYSINKRIKNISKNVISSELSHIRISINNAMSELRSTVYGYSWNKEGVNSFVSDIKNYIDTIRKYQGVDIQLELNGEQDLLSLEQKRSIYRIISEATGNSVKHGKAKHITIQLNVEVSDILLLISDDGIGFDRNILENENRMGLGIHNMHYLVHSLDGSIKMDSNIGKGTIIIIHFPMKSKSNVCREGVI